MAQYSVSSPGNLEKELRQYLSRIGSKGGKAKKRDSRLMQLAQVCAAHLGPKPTIHVFLDWWENNPYILEGQAPDFFDWKVIRDADDIYKSLIQWSVSQSACPNKRFVKRFDDDAGNCECQIMAKTLLYDYVRSSGQIGR